MSPVLITAFTRCSSFAGLGANLTVIVYPFELVKLNNINNFCQYLGRSYPRGNFLNPERLIFRCKIIFKL